MDSLLANIAIIAAPVCAFLAFIWAVAVKKPHDTEEQHNREMLRQQLQNFTEAMTRLEKKAFEAIQELKVAIRDLTKELSDITKDKERFDVRLEKCEKETERNTNRIEELAKIIIKD